MLIDNTSNSPTQGTMLDAALQYAGRGWHVLPLHSMREGKCSCGQPCGKPGKHPRTKRGYLDATTDRKTIEAWWHAWPDANIGVAAKASGLVIVDLDGPEARKQLHAFLPSPPPTLVAKTGREDGFHLWYAGTCKTTSRGKIDVRGSSGYVVAPPSSHYTGNTYQWLNALPLAPVPAEIVAWAGKRPNSDKFRQIPTILDKPPPPHIAARARRGLANIDQETERQSKYPRFLNALKLIPADCGYEDWFALGAAIHDFDPSETGLSVFKRWSRQSERHGTPKDDKTCEEKWLEYQKGENKQDRITVASIYFRAQEIERQQAIPANTANGVNNTINGVAVTLPAQLAQGSPIRFPDLDRAGRPKPTCANARVAIRRLNLSCRYDAFHQKYDVAGQQIGQWSGDITDDMVHVLRIVTLDQFQFDPGSQHAFDAAVQECLQHSYDPILDYLNGLQWDGTPRLGTWLPDYLGADATPFNKAVGELSLTAAVRRVRQPGCKFDHVPTFEGLESIGKSSAIAILAGQENFSDQEILTLDDRRQQEALQGVWLYELAELAGMHRADTERVKAFVTRMVDRTRPAYGRKRIDKPRRCIFFATCNPSHYLLSQTGNRRFWPVKCNWVKLDALQKARDQLWAEASLFEAKKLPLVLPASLWTDASALQDSRRIRDPWEEELQGIEQYKVTQQINNEYRITTASLLGTVLQIARGQQTPQHTKRLIDVMRALGWEGPKDIRVKLSDDREDTGVLKGYHKPVAPL